MHIVYGGYVPSDRLLYLWGGQFVSINLSRYESLTQVKKVTDPLRLLDYLKKQLKSTFERCPSSFRPWTVNNSLRSLLGDWEKNNTSLVSLTPAVPSKEELVQVQIRRESFSVTSSLEVFRSSQKGDRAVIIEAVNRLSSSRMDLFVESCSPLKNRSVVQKAFREIEPAKSLRLTLLHLFGFGTIASGAREMISSYQLLGKSLIFLGGDKVSDPMFSFQIAALAITIVSQVYSDIFTVEDYVFDQYIRGVRIKIHFSSGTAFWKEDPIFWDQFVRLVRQGWTRHPPMVSPPKPWVLGRGKLSVNFSGGYLTNGSIYSLPFVKDNPDSELVPLGSTLVEAINKLQASPFTLDDEMLQFLIKITDITDSRLESLLDSINRIRRSSKSSSSISLLSELEEDFNFSILLRSIRNERVSIKQDTGGLNIFYFPYSYDFRGRVYPLSTNITPTGSKLARSLLRFGSFHSFDERSFFLYSARLFFSDRTLSEEDYLDKFSKELRPRMDVWTSEDRSFHTQAHEPPLFLSCLFEWSRYRVSQISSFKNNLPVFLDATASGSQIVSLLTRDRNLASAANLGPSTSQDILSLLFTSLVSLTPVK